MSAEQPSQRPEGKIIQEALKADGRSIRQVAPLAGISDARWRQLVKGSMQVSPGVHRPEIAPALTLARMADVVGVSADQLREAGRDDAAQALEKLREPAEVAPTPAASSDRPVDEIDLIYASTTMTAAEKLHAIRMVLELREQAARESAARKEAPARKAGAEVSNNS